MRTFDYSTLSTILWDSEILSLVAQIHEHKGRQTLYLNQKPDILENLVEIAKIQSTEFSNRIEGIITTTTRLKQLYNEKTTPKNRDEQEILGYRDVLNTIHENYDHIFIKPSYILQFHRDLYQYSQKSIGGKFKSTQNIIAKTDAFGMQEVLFTPLSPFETPNAVDELCQSFNLAYEKMTIDPLILIPIFIIDFLCIHPFSDGNGRMSRLLTMLLLYKSGYFVGRYISIEEKIEKTKESYYSSLFASNQNWHKNKNDYTHFIKYLLRIILAAYKDFEERINMLDPKLPALELVRNSITKKYGKFTKGQIMELAPTIGKASVENSLKQLVTEGVLVKEGVGRATYYYRKE